MRIHAFNCNDYTILRYFLQQKLQTDYVLVTRTIVMLIKGLTLGIIMQKCALVIRSSHLAEDIDCTAIVFPVPDPEGFWQAVD